MTNMAHDAANAVDTAIGERIHTIMWRRRVSQVDLAARIGVSQSTLSKKLRGVVPMTISELYRIAAELGVPAADLLPRLDSNQEPSGYLSLQVSAV